MLTFSCHLLVLSSSLFIFHELSKKKEKEKEKSFIIYFWSVILVTYHIYVTLLGPMHPCLCVILSHCVPLWLCYHLSIQNSAPSTQKKKKMFNLNRRLLLFALLIQSARESSVWPWLFIKAFIKHGWPIKHFNQLTSVHCSRSVSFRRFKKEQKKIYIYWFN